LKRFLSIRSGKRGEKNRKIAIPTMYIRQKAGVTFKEPVIHIKKSIVATLFL
jgi:hypothetical protein